MHGRVGALRHFMGGVINEKGYHNRTRVWERRSRDRAQFGELKIVVNTPYYMTENNQGSFSGTEKGYELTLTCLPEKELTFTLSESEHPLPPKLSIPFKLMFLLAVITGFVLIGGGVIAVVLIIKRKKSRGKEQS